MNSLYQQLQQNQQLVSQQQTTKSFPQTQKNNLISNLLKSSNPEEAIMNMAKSNPQMQNILQVYQNSNLTPKQFFYQYAQQHGVNPDQFINSLKQE